MNKSILLVTGLMITLLVSCTDEKRSDSVSHNKQVEGKKDEIAFEDADSEDLAAINQNVISFGSELKGMSTTAAKGSLWTSFARTFKDCFQDETFKKNIVYLGPSNSKYLGAILSKDKSTTWKTLEMAFGSRYNDEIIKITKPGSGAPDNCDKSEMLSNYFNVLLDGGYTENLDGELKLALEDRKNIKMLTGKWRIDEIVQGDFNTYMDTTKNKSILDYKKYLDKKGNYLLTKVLIIENFSAEIESNRAINAGLKAKLDTGVSSVIKTDEPAQANVDLKFSRTSNGKVKVTATGKSLVLGMLQKVSITKE